MKTIMLTDDVKLDAKLVAEARNFAAKDIERAEGKFHKGYTPLEVNWQGAIAEVQLAKLYPHLKLSQPYVVYDGDTRESDFIYQEHGIEVKCNRFYRLYPHFFINQQRFDKKRDLAEYLIACAINSSPERAISFYLFGYLESEEVVTYPVRKEYSSPAYAVPTRAFKPLDDLLKPFNLANYMGGKE